MVSDIYEPTVKGKATSAVELRNKIQSKDLRRLQKTTKDFTSLKTLQKDSKNHGKQQSSSTSDGLD